jgi:3-hydroxyisobutyrate dehydrogenase-like beta-hydroxyacid dehydrogenase
MTARGIAFVDGGIIGPATMTPGKVWLYLAGGSAEQAASYFEAGPMQPQVLGDGPGQASALKMCFAAYSKGYTALLASVLAAAENLGVRDELEHRWPVADAAGRVQQSAPKAWRFVPEMHEIAATFEAAGVNPGFPEAAAEIYQHLAGFKDTKPNLEEIISCLIRVHPRSSVAKS